MRPVPKELYPFTGNFLDLDGLRYHYLDEGAGSPVVMVHGNPTWSFYFRKLVTALSDQHRVVVPDHIGCGYSDKPGDDLYTYTLSRRISDLESLVDHLGLEDITLVVHDWGGAIGLGWAVRHPDLVRRLVLLNTAAFQNPVGKRLPFPLWLARNTFVGAVLVRGFNAFARGATRLAVSRKPLQKALRDAYCAPYSSWAERIATLRFVQDIPLSPGDPAWQTLSATQDGLEVFRKKPVLICWGDRDFVFDQPFLDRWSEIYPEAEVHRFADSGHYVLEDSAERIIPLVQDFVARP